MLPVCPCILGPLCSLRGVAALTCIADSLVGLLVFCAPEEHDHDDAALAAQVSSTYPWVVTQLQLYEVAGIFKGDRLSIHFDHVGTNNPRDRGRKAKPATFAPARRRQCRAAKRSHEPWVGAAESLRMP